MQALTGVVHFALLIIVMIAIGVAVVVGGMIWYRQTGQEEGE